MDNNEQKVVAGQANQAKKKDDDKYDTYETKNITGKKQTDVPVSSQLQGIQLQPGALTTNNNLNINTNTNVNLGAKSNTVPVVPEGMQVVNGKVVPAANTSPKNSKAGEDLPTFEVKVAKPTVGPRSPGQQADTKVYMATNKDELTPKEQKTLTKEEKEIANDKLHGYNDTSYGVYGPKPDVYGRTTNGGKEGLVYHIEEVANHPEKIKLEGYILYEQPLDTKKQLQLVYNLKQLLAKPTDEIELKTQDFIKNTTTEALNSRFDEESLTERNKFSNAINSVTLTREIALKLVEILEDDINTFNNFNLNLQYLKEATKLDILLKAKNEVNGKNTILYQDSDLKTYDSIPPRSISPKRIDETKYEEYAIEPIQKGRYDTDFKYRAYVTTTRYLRIKDDDLMESVDWDRKDDFKGQVQILERRLQEANRIEQITYKGLDIIEMDDSKSWWYDAK